MNRKKNSRCWWVEYGILYPFCKIIVKQDWHRCIKLANPSGYCQYHQNLIEKRILLQKTRDMLKKLLSDDFQSDLVDL